VPAPLQERAAQAGSPRSLAHFEAASADMTIWRGAGITQRQVSCATAGTPGGRGGPWPRRAGGGAGFGVLADPDGCPVLPRGLKARFAALSSTNNDWSRIIL
jgi:hypothetical protein